MRLFIAIVLLIVCVLVFVSCGDSVDTVPDSSSCAEEQTFYNVLPDGTPPPGCCVKQEQWVSLDD